MNGAALLFPKGARGPEEEGRLGPRGRGEGFIRRRAFFGLHHPNINYANRFFFGLHNLFFRARRTGLNKDVKPFFSIPALSNKIWPLQ